MHRQLTKMIQCFNFFDKNKNGFITKNEIWDVLRIDNPDLTDDVVEYLINQVDTDNDGKINFEEFK